MTSTPHGMARTAPGMSDSVLEAVTQAKVVSVDVGAPQPPAEIDPESTPDAGPSDRINADNANFELNPDRVSPAFMQKISRDFAREHLIISQCADGDRSTHNGHPVERCAVCADINPAVIHNVGVRLGCRVKTFESPGQTIAKLIDTVYGREGERTGAAIRNVANSGDGPEDAEGYATEEIDRLLATADRDLLSTQGKSPVVRLVDALLFEALSQGASDIHVQPLEDRTLIRYRLDGVLHTVREIERRHTAPIISRIKVMGRMDIAEQRVPQDGRATVTIGDQSMASPITSTLPIDAQRSTSNTKTPTPGTPSPGCAPGFPAPGLSGRGGGVVVGARGTSGGGGGIDLRISTLPTKHGERAVIRLLDHSSQMCSFDQLHMPADLAAAYLECAHRANGIVLITGPTGSGKTTTLYATLCEIGSSALNIMTIEDPIEYELSSSGVAISQAQVNMKKGVTFAHGLRHILRQDPDVIMVGEIRDGETARIAIQSSLTGHLVFSTLHTNDAPSAVTRLIDLGVEPYLVSASLSAVLAQRLVRTVHGDCKGEGCERCLHSGLLGRRGLFELLVVDESIRQRIARRAEADAIRSHARAAGMRTLHTEGLRLVESGITTPVEVGRVTQEVL